MTIASELTKLNTNLENSYTAVSNKGGEIPQSQNFDNLSTAIDSIPTGEVITPLNVTPTTSDQTITASGEVDGYSPVNISAVTSAIDNNIQSGNIKDGVTILGVTGTYTGGGITPTGTISITQNGIYDVTNYASADVSIPGSATLITKSITANGTYNASSDNADGYSSVTVNVPSSGGVGITREVSQSGVFQMPSSSFTFSLPSNVTDVGDYALYYAFYDSANITDVDLSSLTTVSGYYALRYAFYYCTNLTLLNLSSLTTVSGESAFGDAFRGCTNLTGALVLSNLTTISGRRAFASIFRDTNIISISFPALTSTSFGSYTDQFNRMLTGVTGCTVHFPSNLQSVIGSWSDVTAGFGGTNTTILFDLPATT